VLGLAAGLGLGALLAPTGLLRLALGLRGQRWSVALTQDFWLPRTLDAPGSPELGGRFWLWTTGTAGEMSTTASSSSTGDTGDTGEVSSTGSTGGPDPDYVRECQDGDFVCDDWGCVNGPVVKPAECYKRCTPDVIGEPDAECDEPERPFCSQIGRAYAGDFDCNGCAHICVAASINQCNQDIASCE